MQESKNNLVELDSAVGNSVIFDSHRCDQPAVHNSQGPVLATEKKGKVVIIDGLPRLMDGRMS